MLPPAGRVRVVGSVCVLALWALLKGHALLVTAATVGLLAGHDCRVLRHRTRLRCSHIYWAMVDHDSVAGWLPAIVAFQCEECSAAVAAVAAAQECGDVGMWGCTACCWYSDHLSTN
jgi:hypothetical protein